MSRPNDVRLTGDQHLESQGAKKNRKISRVRLPTPPPDPTIHAPVTRKTSRSDKDSDGGSTRKSSRNERDTDFFDYLESWPQHGSALSRSTSMFAPAVAAEEAFDHLEKLYKLTDQMLQLREQNARLHRRVRDLEHLRNLQDMDQMLNEQQMNLDDLPSANFDQDSIYAENMLQSILRKSGKQFRFGQSILRKSQRYTSSSIVFDKDGDGVDKMVTASCDKKVSKWTKVKAAFKWEKASSTVSDAKSQDSGLSGMVPVNYEVARYLRVPSTSDEVGISPGDSGAAEASTPGTISSASSNEDIHRHSQVRRKNIGYTSDEDQVFAFDSVSINKDDQKPSSSKFHPHRTPWAKMKEIINTRSSVKKQHRLSTRSEDFKIDDSICSENEDVFESEDAPRSPVLIVQSPEEVLRESLAAEKAHSIPLEIIGRYHQVLAEDEMKESHERYRSKWSKVKEAFLPSSDINRIDNTCPSPVSNKKDSNSSDYNLELHDEIQQNYFQLQQKLSIEFQDKLRDWERSKQGASSSPSTNNGGMSSEECRDPAFKKKMEEWERIKGLSKPTTPTSPTPQLTSEQNLPPEFRRKLDEWKRIKKISRDEANTSNVTGAKKRLGEWPKWKSISSKTEPETPQYSGDFLKKLEEWKHIKGANNDDDKWTKRNRTPSPLIARKESSIKEHKRIRDQTDKELHWFAKELSKIDREKQRLERERQKFLEDDERITKMRKSIAGNNTAKKDILVHTPSGYYRFEGISRKFTQKLYEWEKAQGIGPESSTFALLRSSNIPYIRSPVKGNEHRPSLVRSKSADSVINSESNPPVLSPQPSSLSLNDVDNLEKEVMLGGMADDPIPDILDNVDEPEALIVEVEDIEEETAAPLRNFTEKHTPVYHRQDNNLCEGKAKDAPTVRQSESTKAQANYNIIEDILSIIRNMVNLQEVIESRSHSSDCKLNSKDNLNSQMTSADQLFVKVVSLQEANTIVTLDVVPGNTKDKSVTDVLETINDLTNKSFHLAKRINVNIRNILRDRSIKFALHSYQSIITDNLKYLNNLILDVRRKLSYICAASDTAIPNPKKQSVRKTCIQKSPSSDMGKYVISKSRCHEHPVDFPKSTDTETSSRTDKNSPKSEHVIKSEQGAIKKRLKYRQKGSNSKTFEDSDEDDKEILMEQRKNKPRRGIKAQNSSDSNKSSSDKMHKDPKPDETLLVVDPKFVEKVVIPTESGFVNIEHQYQPNIIPEDTPVTIFVKTTRKLFTPIVVGLSEVKPVTQKLLTPPDTPIPTRKKLFRSKTDELAPSYDTVMHLPPLPASPTPQRKAPKDISPNIRMMLVRYNQKLNEESLSNNKSGGSSGSASPIAWRSPVLERRVKAQTEKYQMEIQKLSPLLGGRREVQKSASVGVMCTGSKQVTVHEKPKQADLSKGILKSTSIGVIRSEEKVVGAPETPLESVLSCSTVTITPTRSDKIQKAKEEFFKTPVVTERTTSLQKRNRLSQLSVASDTSDSSSYNVLVKSASAGMINIDPTYYKQFEPELHSDGYVSLPRSSKGLLSNITSKFRKVKMRRGKDHHSYQYGCRMNTISQLCRQSLLVDINTNLEVATGANSRGSQETLPLPESNRSSGQSSPAGSRTGSWIRKPMFFKSNK